MTFAFVLQPGVRTPLLTAIACYLNATCGTAGYLIPHLILPLPLFFFYGRFCFTVPAAIRGDIRCRGSYPFVRAVNDLAAMPRASSYCGFYWFCLVGLVARQTRCRFVDGAFARFPPLRGWRILLFLLPGCCLAPGCSGSLTYHYLPVPSPFVLTALLPSLVAAFCRAGSPFTAALLLLADVVGHTCIPHTAHVLPVTFVLILRTGSRSACHTLFFAPLFCT